MKKIYSLVAGLLLTASVWAQAPQKMSYQAVIRNSSNALVTSTPVGMQISILQGSSTGTVAYSETQTVSTNANGLVSLEIGTGTVITGTFAAINWATGPYFIKTETDPAGGTAYTISGTNELMSVPYALFSANGTPGATGAPGAPGAPGSVDAWSRIGNDSTVDGTNFIGTTDNIPFTIKVNNEKAGRIDVSTAGNTFYGYQSGNSNSGNNYNTGIGQQSLFSNTTGTENTASGVNALYYNTTGYSNTASGASALYSNTTGSSNTASGRNALYANTTGFFNTASGIQALYLNTTGNYNTANGQSAGSLITTGSNNIAIGYDAQVANAAGNNQIRIGDANILLATTQINWSTTSDKRWKSDIQPSNLGLDFISKLKPVSYTRNNDERKKREYGFIAQDLEETLNASGAADNGIISKDDAGMYGVRYNDLMAPMVKAIQEQQELIKTMNKKMGAMQKEIDNNK